MMKALRIGLLLALVCTLAHTEDEEVIKCPDGECVKLHLCIDGELVTDGTNLIDIRFNPDDPCEHYLLKCCKIPDIFDPLIPPPSQTEAPIIIPPPSGGGPDILPPPPSTGPTHEPTKTDPGSGHEEDGHKPGHNHAGGEPCHSGCPLHPTGSGGSGGYGTHPQPGPGLNQGAGGYTPPGSGSTPGTGGSKPQGSSGPGAGSGTGGQTPAGSGTNLGPGSNGAQAPGSSSGPGGNQQQGSGVGSGVNKPTQGSSSGSGVGGPHDQGSTVGSGSNVPHGSGSPSGTGGSGPQTQGPSSGSGGNVPHGTGSSSGLGGSGPQTQGPSTGSGGNVPHGTGSSSGLGGSGPQTQGPTSGSGGSVPYGPGSSSGLGGSGPQTQGPTSGSGGSVPHGTGPNSGLGGSGPQTQGPTSGSGGNVPHGPGLSSTLGGGGLHTQVPTSGSGGNVPHGPGSSSGPGGSGPQSQGPTSGPSGNVPHGQGVQQGSDQQQQVQVPGLGPEYGGSKPGPGGYGGVGTVQVGQGPIDLPSVAVTTEKVERCSKPSCGGGVTSSPLSPEKTGCGHRNADGVGFRITGNNDGESEYGEFPWMVAILKEEKALDQTINVYQCGGSLIHPQVVLTAAHCVQNKKPAEIKIRLGEWDTQTTNEIYDHQDRNVVDIVVHKEFYKGGLFNDVALLFLDKPAELIDTVNTVCLPPQDMSFDLERCFASGWGKDTFGKDGKYQVILKKIELPVMPFTKCQNALRTTRLGKRFILNKSFICAGGEPGRDTCKGDGGSPLVCPVPGTINRYYQAGIVAWGIGCGETGIPGVYVNVAGFRNWIDEHLTQRSISHDYYLLV